MTVTCRLHEQNFKHNLYTNYTRSRTRSSSFQDTPSRHFIILDHQLSLFQRKTASNLNILYAILIRIHSNLIRYGLINLGQVLITAKVVNNCSIHEEIKISYGENHMGVCWY